MKTLRHCRIVPFLLPGLLGLAAAAGLTGCHSAFVNAQVVNHTGSRLRLIEVDYPSASFGTEDLQPGSVFRSRFKIQGSGGLKLTWTDAAEHEHSSKGPNLHEGQEGRLTIEIGPEGVNWQPELQH